MSRGGARPVLTVLVYAWVMALLLVHAVVCLALLPYTLLFDRDRRVASRLGSGMVRHSMRLVACGRPAARVLSAIDLQRPAVVVINHRSMADVAIALAIPGAPRLSAKPWVARLPLFRIGIWAAGHEVFEPADLVAVRNNLSRLERLIDRGVSVVFFPEGTRHSGEGLGRFASGAFWLAARTETDVLPVIIRGSDDLIPRGRAMFFDADVRVEVLARVPACKDREELARRTHDLMSTRLACPPTP